ncbi:hypothetical protein ACHQM5_021571 [Ranunculus cassubicifolius]
MSQYFLHAKQLSDSLAASGNQMSTSDLQQIILQGLDSAYDAIVTTLTATVDDIEMEDFYAHLLAFDMRVEAQNSILHQQSVANVASYQRSNQTKHGSSSRSQPRFSQANHQTSNNRGSNRSQNRPQPVANASGPCQLCGRKNHAVVDCCCFSKWISVLFITNGCL